MCNYCKGPHAISLCPKFTRWSPDVRIKWVWRYKLCFRCLGDDYWSPKCELSIAMCTMLTEPSFVGPPNAKTPTVAIVTDSNDSWEDQSSIQPTSSFIGYLSSQVVLLGTALVHIRDCAGVLHTARALVDSASQISAITSACSSRLGLCMSRWTAPVSGLSILPVVNVQGTVDCGLLHPTAITCWTHSPIQDMGILHYYSWNASLTVFGGNWE